MSDETPRTAVEVIAAEEQRIREYVDFDRHRDECVGEINGMRRALRMLAAAGLLVTAEHGAPIDPAPTDDDLRAALNVWDDRLDLDRWLAEHDAQVRAKALEPIWDVVTDWGAGTVHRPSSPYYRRLTAALNAAGAQP